MFEFPREAPDSYGAEWQGLLGSHAVKMRGECLPLGLLFGQFETLGCDEFLVAYAHHVVSSPRETRVQGAEDTSEPERCS